MKRTILVTTIVISLIFTVPVFAGKRLALVIGNSGYKSYVLKNPVNDLQ